MQELSCECFPRVRAAINEFLRDMQTYPHSASPTLSKPFPSSIK
jgi:hypothetical protein